MIQIKKTILTLVALLAVTTGAWAQEQWDVVWDFTAWSTETVTALKADAAASNLEGWSDIEKEADAVPGAVPTAATKDNCFWSCSGTVNADGNLSANGAVIKELKGLKFNSDYAAKRSLAIAVNYPSTALGDYAGGAYLLLGGGGSKQTFPCFTIPGVKAGSKITIEVESHKPSDGRGIGLYKNSYAAENLIGEQFKPTAKEAKTWEIAEDCDVVVWNTSNCHIYTIKVKAPAAAASSSSGPEVAWNAATKTGTFTMPGGNVTLEPEYYPQATVADGGVTAADADARATTDDPLVKVDATKLTGAKKLMYFVSNSGTTAPAYDAEGWTDQLPTAEGFTQQGIVYVWYYPVGIDEGVDGATATYSDGDICLQSITARIAAEPTYAVTFKAANTNTIESGKATVTVGGTAATVTEGKLEGVKMGSEVKVKANTGYKFRKVEAKKGGGEPVLLTTITAADNSSFKSGSQTFGDVATVTLTGDYLTNDGSHGGWYCLGSNLTATISVAEANGANITSVKFYTAGGGSAEDKDAPFEVTTTSVTSSDITTYLNGNSIGSYGVSKIEVYGTK